MPVGRKVIGSVLIIISAACLVLLIIGSLGKDKNAPEISFPEGTEITYAENEPESKLLKDVTAFDKEDGEVTDSLIIESIYDFNNGTAKVVYAVRDKSGNITKAERIISYVKAEEPEITPAAVDAFAGNEAADENQNVPGGNPDITPKEPEEGELRPDGAKPALRLKESRVVIKKGSAFNQISYVDEVVDDKDNREQLFRRISVRGECNTKQAGTYQLGYRVTDSDGNVSAEKTLTVIVE